jgi:hypothetical protein
MLAIGFADTQNGGIVRRVSGNEKSSLKVLGNDRFESSEGRRREGILRDINKCGGVFKGNDNWVTVCGHLRMIRVPNLSINGGISLGFKGKGDEEGGKVKEGEEEGYLWVL